MEDVTLRLDKEGAPLYMQVYEYFAREIRAGRVGEGEKLPSKRRLAQDLRVSVNTVDTAYSMLAAEGYAEARPKSGFYACRVDAPAPPAQTSAPAAPREAAPPAFRYDFETSGVDTSLFPFKTWRRIQRELLSGEPSLLNPGHRQGDENLREAIASHLREARGASAAAEQIVVGAGIEYLMGILARMFAGETFAVETPGYARTHRILENNGARVAYVPVDRGGEELLGKTPRQIHNIGVSMAFVPEDRLGMGLVGSMGMADNMMLKSYRAGRGPLLDRKPPRQLAERVKAELDVLTPSINTPVRRLSGGNVQKVLVGREISQNPSVLMTAYAVRGLDINTSYTIYNLLTEQKMKGVAVIYVGEDLDVLLELCDRILVLCGGQVSGIVDGRSTSKEEVGLLMTRFVKEGAPA